MASHKESGGQVRDVAHFFLIQLSWSVLLVFNHIHNHSPHMSHEVPALEETDSLFKFKRTVHLKWSVVEICEATRKLATLCCLCSTSPF